MTLTASWKGALMTQREAVTHQIAHRNAERLWVASGRASGSSACFYCPTWLTLAKRGKLAVL